MNAFLLCGVCSNTGSINPVDAANGETYYAPTETGESLMVYICVHVRRMVGKASYTRTMVSVTGTDR